MAAAYSWPTTEVLQIRLEGNHPESFSGFHINFLRILENVESYRSIGYLKHIAMSLFVDLVMMKGMICCLRSVE